ncbi:hypothetical protein C6P18_02440 [Weissella confusa]|uniref:hypothetical protein n=1 Tax=Weissella confusa TaxID=1583 RepID=UPI0010816DF1|nr:hypothetical protein [Weissella confusa]TGE53381.1 hypothetical protein C6P18_02440 [Weissella confusa]
MKEFISWVLNNFIALIALTVSLVTLILKIRDYRTKIVVPNVYMTAPINGTQKIVLVVSNESSHPVSITDLTFQTYDLENLKPKFGNYKIWSNGSYSRYTAVLPITFSYNESKLIIFEVDNRTFRCLFVIQICKVYKTCNTKHSNQTIISQ